MRNAVRSLAALLRSRPLQPASPDLAERIIRKAKHIRQRTNQTAIKLGCPEKATQKKENPCGRPPVPAIGLLFPG